MMWFGGVYDDPRHQFPSMAIDADNPDVDRGRHYADDRRDTFIRSGWIAQGDLTIQFELNAAPGEV